MIPKHAKLLAEGLQGAVGIDEAGRGPLAGPVVAAAVCLPLTARVAGLQDSKQLSAKRRERCYDQLIKEAWIGVGYCGPAEIDRYNILQASLMAMHRAVKKLGFTPELCVIDGCHTIAGLDVPQRTIVKGDQLCSNIAAASIIAKVTRDREMIAWDQHFPQYGFAQHKGYPTKQHRRALEAWGACCIHRRSFIGVEGVSPVREIRHNRPNP